MRNDSNDQLLDVDLAALGGESNLIAQDGEAMVHENESPPPPHPRARFQPERPRYRACRDPEKGEIDRAVAASLLGGEGEDPVEAQAVDGARALAPVRAFHQREDADAADLAAHDDDAELGYVCQHVHPIPGRRVLALPQGLAVGHGRLGRADRRGLR